LVCKTVQRFLNFIRNRIESFDHCHTCLWDSFVYMTFILITQYLAKLSVFVTSLNFSKVERKNGSADVRTGGISHSVEEVSR
jgi:hypothetical protein